MKNQPFIRGEKQSDPIPLKEYLPGYRQGVVSSWLGTLPNRPELVIFPFGGSPQAALEAARTGYRVLTPIHNPITRFLLQGLTQPPSKDDLNAALVRLASSYKGKKRLKPFILSLYETECPQCGARISAKSFTWSKSKGVPIKKVCLCHKCSEPTEASVTQDDINSALAYHENSPSHARALTRVAAPDDPVRFQAANALRKYPPRTVYALFTILNKLTGFDLTGEERQHLETLLLYAFYICSSPESSAQNSNSPGEADFYQEENVWFSLEEALKIWSTERSSLPLSTWPDLPPESGGITVFPGRVRDLISQLDGLENSAAVLVFPKPNLTFWALSALWTGWLWGQGAAASLRSILSLQNLDWVWLIRAINNTLSDLYPILPAGTNCFGLLPDLEIEYLISVVTAANTAGFNLESIAVDPDISQGQINLTPGKKRDIKPDLTSIKEVIRKAGFKVLEELGEPKHTLCLYSAGLFSLSEEGILAEFEENNLEENYQLLMKNFEETIAYRQGFLFYSKPETWWHQELKIYPDPQSDQIERTLVEQLVKNKSPLPEAKIYANLYQKFPGLSTPQNELIKVCLKSYAEKITGDSDRWALKSTDQPSKRREDIQEIEEILSRLGKQLGFEITKGEAVGNILSLLWQADNSAGYRFFISASGMLNKILTDSSPTPTQPWIILPGSRAELIHYKMRVNPPLVDFVSDRWGLVKYRHIRRLADEGGLTLENLSERLALDPFTSDAPQLPLI
jgi:hypothetical protein